MNVRKYRRDGTPYPPGHKGVFEWCADFDDLTLRQVRLDRLPDGSEISTIWFGIDLAPLTMIPVPDNMVHVPLIFETVVFDPEGNILLQERWATEKEAAIGHIKIVHAMQREGRAKKQEPIK